MKVHLGDTVSLTILIAKFHQCNLPKKTHSKQITLSIYKALRAKDSSRSSLMLGEGDVNVSTSVDILARM